MKFKTIYKQDKGGNMQGDYLSLKEVTNTQKKSKQKNILNYKQQTLDNFFPIKKRKEEIIEKDSNYFVNLSLESNCLNKTTC